MHYEKADGRSELTVRIILASTESFGAGLTSGLQWNTVTSEVARSSRFEGTAFPDDPSAFSWIFKGVWASSQGQTHVVCVSN